MTVKEFASLGGMARGRALSAKRRREIASNGGKAKALKHKTYHNPGFALKSL